MARMAPGPDVYVLFDTRPAIAGDREVTIFDPIAESGSDPGLSPSSIRLLPNSLPLTRLLHFPGPGQVFVQAELPALMRNTNVKRIFAVRKTYNIFIQRLQWDVDAVGSQLKLESAEY